MIKFNKYHVVDTETKVKARVHYSIGGRRDSRSCVTLYAEDYNDNLFELFGDIYENQTDTMTDYFEKGRVNLFADHPLFDAAMKRAEANEEAARIRSEKRMAKCRARWESATA